jgi:Cache domain
VTSPGQPPGAAPLGHPVLADPVLADPVLADPVLAARATSLLTGITQRIGQVLARVTDIGAAAESIAAATQAAGPPLRRDDFSPLRRLVAELLRAHAGLAAGAGVVLAPGTLADAPRCIEWWWADQQAQVSQLHVDLDPESAEFYDYTTTEWYREPERTGQPSVAGPYVDFICTRQYTFTLAAPIRCAGRFIGVAGADILAAQVERLVLPGLAGLGRTAVLASGHGRVIASTSATLPPGAALPRRPGAAGFVPLAGPGPRPPAGWGQAPDLLPWTLLAVPAG